jgi:hypothetical protein
MLLIYNTPYDCISIVFIMNSQVVATTASTSTSTSTSTSGRSKSKLSAQLKEQYDNVTEKMEGGILVRRYKGEKMLM